MYKLDENLLKKYAQVMVHYGLNNGKGINKGETVFLVGQECSKDLFIAIAKEIYEAGGNAITNYLPDNTRKSSLAGLHWKTAAMNKYHFLQLLTGKVLLIRLIMYSLLFQNPIFMFLKDYPLLK